MPKKKKANNEEINLDELKEQADAAYDADDWDKAIELYTKIANQKDKEAEGIIYYRLGYSYAKKGDYDEAIEYCQKAIDTPGYDTPGNSWYNMGVAYGNKGDHDKVIECCQKAIDTPGYDTPGNSWYNMGVAYENKGDHDKAIECCQNALDTPSYSNSGSAWYNMGVAYDNKGDYDKAIECYQNAIDTPGYSNSGSAWYNMGIAYRNKGDYDKAIECYQKAIDTSGYDTPGSTWNNMGLAYADKENYDKAIECYQKALDTPGYDTPGYAWNNMGLAYSGMGDYDKAIAYHQQAINDPNYDTPERAWRNLGAALKAKGNLIEAEAAFEQAANFYFQIDDTANAEDALVQAGMIRLAQKLGKDAVEEQYPALSATAPSDESADPDDPWNELKQLEKGAQTEAEEYADRARKPERDKQPQNVLVFLKGWSSSEPFIASGTDRDHAVQGGGLFLRWGGKGAVIDPGINFLSNFHKANYFVQDIDAIIITHDHVDHHFDFHAIDDLIYSMREFQDNERQRYCFFSNTAYNSFGPRFKEANYYIREVPFGSNIVGATNAHKTDCLPGVILNPFSTKHAESSFGLKCILEKSTNSKVHIGITSDTEFFSDLPETLQDCQLIVAHMSSPDSHEYVNPHKLKEKARHLGLNGTRRLIAETNAQVYVITEFWAGQGDKRIPLCQKLKYDLKKHNKDVGEKCIIPADIGLIIEFDFDMKGNPLFNIKCTSCGKPTLCGDISVIRPDKPYGQIRYLCPECDRRLKL